MQCRGGEMHRLGSGTGEVGMELDDVHFQNLTDISDKIRRIQISPIAVTEALLDRIATYDGKYGSYITVLRERAFLLARAASRHPSRPQGSVRHEFCADGRRNADAPHIRPGRECDRGEPA